MSLFSENISTFMFYFIPGTRSICHASNFSADECASVFCYYNIEAVTQHNWAFSLCPLWYLHSHLHSHSLINFILNIFNLFSRPVWYTIPRRDPSCFGALCLCICLCICICLGICIWLFKSQLLPLSSVMHNWAWARPDPSSRLGARSLNKPTPRRTSFGQERLRDFSENISSMRGLVIPQEKAEAQ